MPGTKDKETKKTKTVQQPPQPIVRRTVDHDSDHTYQLMSEDLDSETTPSPSVPSVGEQSDMDAVLKGLLEVMARSETSRLQQQEDRLERELQMGG